MKQNSLILFSVGLLLLCAGLFNTHAGKQTNAVVETRKVSRLKRKKRLLQAPSIPAI